LTLNISMIILRNVPKPVPADLRQMVGVSLGPEEFSWNARDVMLYAAAVGATPEHDLAYLYELHGPHVIPTFGNLGATHVFFRSIPDLPLDLSRLLHGEETTVIHRPLPPCGTGSVTRKCVGILDKGHAAVLKWESSLSDSSGDLISTTSTSFVKDAGGFGGERTDSGELPFTLPARESDMALTTSTCTAQAALYRLLGDTNPIHIDPGFAANAGYPGPILHGMCTYGTVILGLIRALCDGDSTVVQAYHARFTGAVLPGDSLATEVWLEGPGIAQFETRTSRGTMALSRGRLQWAA
jgi:acyl dehydratase